MNKPLVSVCVPTADRAEFLERSLQGIRAQEYRNLEILIGDNASTDATREVCLRVSERDPRIRYVRREKDIGMYPNHNDLIDRSRGEFLCFLHDDDEFDAALIREEVAFLERHSGAGLVSPDWNLIDEQGRLLGMRRHDVPELRDGAAYIEKTLRSGQSSIGLSGTMIRRSALENSRFDPEGPTGFSDFALWCEIAERWRVGHIPKQLYSYRLHTRSLSRRSALSISKDYRRAMIGFCDGHLKRFPSDERTVRRWRMLIDRYLFWMLGYEICLHFSGRKWESRNENRYRTVFQMMDYRLTDEEFQEALIQFRAMPGGPIETAARTLINGLLVAHWTWPLGRLAPHAPAFRGLLRLQ